MPKHATGSSKPPLSENDRILGQELRALRERAGKSIYEVPGFSDTQVSRVENGLVTASERFIDTYVRHFGGDRVRLMALRGEIKREIELRKRRSAGRAEDEPLPDARTLAPDSDPHELRRLYSIEEIDDYYLMGPSKTTERVVHILRVRPLSPYTRFYVCAYTSSEVTRRGALSLQAGQGCEVAIQDEDDKGALKFVLDFNPSGRPFKERLCEFAFAIDFHDAEPMILKRLLRSFHRSPIRKVVRRVQFTPPAVPNRLWWFRALEVSQSERSPEQGQIIPVNPAQFYFHEFYDVASEHVGLGWDWA